MRSYVRKDKFYNEVREADGRTEEFERIRYWAHQERGQYVWKFETLTLWYRIGESFVYTVEYFRHR